MKKGTSAKLAGQMSCTCNSKIPGVHAPAYQLVDNLWYVSFPQVTQTLTLIDTKQFRLRNAQDSSLMDFTA